MDFKYEEHERAEIQQVEESPKDDCTMMCWSTAVIGVLVRNSKETEEFSEALRRRIKWRTFADRVLMGGHRAARDKIILEQREASRQKQVEESQQI